MSVKVYCSNCNKFLKDAVERSEIRSLTGTEICDDCLNWCNESIEAVKKKANQAKIEIDRCKDSWLAELERMKRKVIHSDEE